VKLSRRRPLSAPPTSDQIDRELAALRRSSRILVERLLAVQVLTDDVEQPFRRILSLLRLPALPGAGFAGSLQSPERKSALMGLEQLQMADTRVGTSMPSEYPDPNSTDLNKLLAQFSRYGSVRLEMVGFLSLPGDYFDDPGAAGLPGDHWCCWFALADGSLAGTHGYGPTPLQAAQAAAADAVYWDAIKNKQRACSHNVRKALNPTVPLPEIVTVLCEICARTWKINTNPPNDEKASD
jgi:hypothetical protein